MTSVGEHPTNSTGHENQPTLLFVVYCAGPHCYAAEKAGARLARLGRHVKKMIGGQIG